MPETGDTVVPVHDDGGGWLPVFPTDWECPVCGQINTEDDQICIDCRLPREAGGPEATGGPER